MNLVPLHSQPMHGIKAMGGIPAMIVNFDHVYGISKSAFFPQPGGEPAEGSRLHIAVPSSGNVITIEVVESRVEIMRMLGACDAHISQCSETNNKNIP